MRLRITVAWVFCTTFCSLAFAAPVEPPKTDASVQHAISDYALTYGVYVGGRKVGTMESSFARRPVPHLGFELTARVSGMGRSSTVRLKESRHYVPVTGQLATLNFVQEADGSKVALDGRLQGKQMRLKVLAGGETQTLTLSVQEHLEDSLRQQQLAAGLVQKRPARPGDKAQSHHLDAATQKIVLAEHVVDAITPTLLGGVSTDVVEMTTRYPELHVEEHATLDRSGKLLTTKIGGFFEARLEPPEVARTLDAPGDLLLGAVVRAPHALKEPHGLPEVRLTLNGLLEAPPASPRQQVSRVVSPGDNPSGATGALPGRYALILRRDAPVPHTPFKPRHGRQQPVTSDKQPPDPSTLLPTPFIQSDHPEIRGTALRAIKNAKYLDEAIENLCHYVPKTLTSAYVPAFSNALDTLHSLQGDCTEHSVLFVALARAVGIAARPVVGLGYWAPGGGFGWHAWAEVWVGDRWVAVDPTWDQPIADATHIKLGEGSPEQQARVVMLLGRLSIESLTP